MDRCVCVREDFIFISGGAIKVGSSGKHAGEEKRRVDG